MHGSQKQHEWRLIPILIAASENQKQNQGQLLAASS